MFLYGIPSLWQIYTMSHVGKQKEVISQLKKTNPEDNWESVQKTNIQEVLTETFPKHKPMFEDHESLIKRGEVIKAFFKEYERMNPLTGDEKYGCVSHSMTIAAMTCEGPDTSEPKVGLKNHIWLNNCQVLPFT